MTKAEKILLFIAENPEGRTLTEIQTFIIQMNYPYNIDMLEVRDGKVQRKHKHRGIYCTNLYGTPYKPGLLTKYCTRLPNKRWLVTEPIVGPWYVMKEQTPSFRAYITRLKGEEQRRLEKLPFCGNCNSRMRDELLVAGGRAHFVYWGPCYKVDCRGVVWFIRDGNNHTSTTLLKDEVYAMETAINILIPDWQTRDKALRKVVETHIGAPRVPLA